MTKYPSTKETRSTNNERLIAPSDFELRHSFVLGYFVIRHSFVLGYFVIRHFAYRFSSGGM